MTDVLALLLAALLALLGHTPGPGPVRGPEGIEVLPGTTPRTSVPVVLRVGHCWIEPVRVDGRLWNVPLDRQIGWGGGLPRGWLGTGTVTMASPRRAFYVDDGSGTRLTLHPADEVGVSLEGQLCD